MCVYVRVRVRFGYKCQRTVREYVHTAYPHSLNLPMHFVTLHLVHLLLVKYSYQLFHSIRTNRCHLVQTKPDLRYDVAALNTDKGKRFPRPRRRRLRKSTAEPLGEGAEDVVGDLEGIHQRLSPNKGGCEEADHRVQMVRREFTHLHRRICERGQGR